MSRKRLAAMFLPLFIAGAAVPASATQASAQPATSDNAAKANETFSVLHAVGQWAISLSEMAEKRAKSDLVKGYARDVTTANKNSDAKLMSIAKKEAIDVKPLDPQTEAGKSLLDRMKGEKDLLGSLSGDAFDKEYMTLVTNTQQSVIHVLETGKSVAKDQELKQFLGEMTTTVQTRLKTAQDIMTKVYGNTI